MTEPRTTEQNTPRIPIPLWIWGMTLAALLFFALTLWQAQKLQSQLAELQLQMRQEQVRKEALQAQRQDMDQIRALLASRETRTVQMMPAAAHAKPFTIFWNEELGLFLTSQDVRALPTGRVFQLWVLPKKGGAISAGIFQPDTNGNVLKLLNPSAPILMKDAAEVKVTIEVGGGSSKPSSVPVWSGRVR